MPLNRPGSAPTVVLVGRPNVGKSTLFNRITNSRQAIVAPMAGTTRDTNAHAGRVAGESLFTSSTPAGCSAPQSDPLHELVVEHGRKAIATADLVVFVVDGREGLVPGDEEIALALRPVEGPVIIAVNKTDDRRSQGRHVEFYSLGFEPIVEIAAEHGEGVGRSAGRDRGPLPRGHQRDPGPGQRGRDPRRHRRAPERRQVLAAQSVAERGARHRQRHAGDDPRHGRRGAQVAEADVPDRGHGRHPAPRTGGAGRPGRRRSAS